LEDRAEVLWPRYALCFVKAELATDVMTVLSEYEEEEEKAEKGEGRESGGVCV
jgi:hypothetical protein